MKKYLILFLVSALSLIPGLCYAQGVNCEEQEVAQLVNEISLATGWRAQDIHLLAQVVHGEARGETYTGKVAVAAVVINRLRSPLFPNTLTEVVFQPKAFTCVTDGQISLTPDLESYRAAFDAILGNDPTDGCLFYMNPKTATSRWMRKRISSEDIRVIGNHIFTK